MDYTIRSFFLYSQGIHDIFSSRIFAPFFHSTFGPRASKNGCSNKSSNKTCTTFIFLPLFIPIDCRLLLLFQKNFFEKISVKITFLLCKLKNIAIPIYYPSLLSFHSYHRLAVCASFPKNRVTAFHIVKSGGFIKISPDGKLLRCPLPSIKMACVRVKNIKL